MYCEFLPKIASEIHIISGNRKKNVSFVLVIREAAQYNSLTEEEQTQKLAHFKTFKKKNQ